MSHTTLPCDTPQSFEPLFSFLHSVTELAFLAGILLGTLGLLTAALFYLLPGEDNTRRAKLIAKNTIIGMVLLLIAPMIIDYLILQLGSGALCQ